MATIGGAGKVVLGERDLSIGVPGSDGVYGAMTIDAKKGKVGWDLVTSRTQLLNRYTENGRIDVGMPMSFYSALQHLKRSNKLWVGRPEVSAKFGTIVLLDTSSNTATLGELVSPLTNLTGFDFSTNEVSFRLFFGGDFAAIKLDTDFASWADLVAELQTQVDATALNGKLEVVDTTGVLSFKATAGNEGATEIRIDSFSFVSEEQTVETVFGFSEGDSAQGESAAVSYPGGDVDPESYTFAAGELVMLHGINPGSWNDKIEVRISKSPNFSNAFVLDVYYNGSGSPVESFTVSREQGAKDGFGRTMYIEEVLKASEYLRAVDNLAVSDTLDFEPTANKINLMGGTNGNAVTDSDMISLLEEIKNTNSYSLRLLMDGGRATPAYHAKIIEVCEIRRDTSFRISVPYAAENASGYMAAIADYRKSQLVISTSMGGIFAGWQKIADEFNDREIFVDPAVFAASRTVFNAQNYEIWYPAAGPIHGALTTLDVKRRFSDGELDELDNMGVNPIKWSTRGIQVHGNSTMLGYPSALGNLNNRDALCEVEPAIKTALEAFLFKYNDPETRGLVTSLLNSYMGSIKGRKGVSDFYIVCSEENNTDADFTANRMNVWVYVKFHGIAKYIPVTLAVTRNGVSFTDIKL